MPMPVYDPGDVVIVPFPFTDRDASKRRPALVCSSTAFNGQTKHAILAMITTATHTAWSDDVPITDLRKAGLPPPSVVRWKLFTLDASLIMRRAGTLASADRRRCRNANPVEL